MAFSATYGGVLDCVNSVRSRCVASMRGGVTDHSSVARIAWLSLTGAWLASAAVATATTAGVGQMILESKELRIVVADNQAYSPEHASGYSGIAELYRRDHERNLFVPQYSGLNFEHIFSGDQASYVHSMYEPREAPMEIFRLAQDRVELRQTRTKHWPLNSRLSYQVQGDAVDFTYCGTPTADAWQKHGYIGTFFASYMNAPHDPAINFIGRRRSEGEAATRWIRHLPAVHGLDSLHAPAASHWTPGLDEGNPIDLLNGRSGIEYVYPFFFGRVGPNVLIMMFERPNARSEVYFAQSPSGGGERNPAWDFVHFQRDYVVGREYCLHARMVYKPFAGRREIISLYERWSGERVDLSFEQTEERQIP